MKERESYTEQRSHTVEHLDEKEASTAEQEDLKANPPAEQSSTSPPYTVFRKSHRRILTVLLATASLTSPFTQTIYLPILPLLARRYSSSTQAINLTITFYSIVQALTPALFAPLSDGVGRRPILLGTFVLYVAASLGLALNTHSYVGLLLLRGVQALGASASVSIAYGVIADICVSSERGSMIGPVMSATNIGTILGPVLGGLIAWRSEGQVWVFWGIFIFGAANVVLMALSLPETARNVVGDGSLGRNTKFSWKQWFMLGPRLGNTASYDNERQAQGEERIQGRQIRFVSPLASSKIALWKDNAIVVVLAGVNYAVWNSFLALVPQIYEHDYAWTQFEVGLAYLPGAVAVVLGGIVNGVWMDHKYKKTAGEVGISINEASGDDLNAFPIEKARCRDLRIVLLIYSASLTGLGWVVELRAHVAITLVLQAFVGLFGTFLFFCFNTLLVDINPDQPSTAAAAATIFRCGLSAALVAAMQPLVDSVGRGWYLTILTIVVGIGQGFGLWAIPKWGWQWRKARCENTHRN